MSIRAYCAMKGLAENTYFYWQRRLRAVACEELSLSRPEQKSLPAAGFTEVRLSETPAQSAMLEAAGAGQLHIEISGVQIIADSGYPVEKLAELLRALSQPC